MLSPTALSSLQESIRNTEKQFSRCPDSVALLAVSKTRGAEEIRRLADLGQHRFGENYLQEAEAKMASLTDLGIEWHFIGRLQSNKAKSVAAHFDWVHTVNTARLARRLDQHRNAEAAQLNVCIQVNISGEASKAGCAPGELPALVAAIAGLPRLRLRGLMALPAPSEDFQLQRQAFQRLTDLYQALNADGAGLDTLSMGTSNDFPAAIAAGATLIRIGTTLFGPRAD